MDTATYLAKAKAGDVHAFHELFAPFQDALASYLYRLTAHREEAADLLHDTYLKAFEKLPSFKSNASLKTWAFTIATNLARNRQRVLRRWAEDTKDRGKALAYQRPEIMQRLWQTHNDDPEGAYHLREHINVCFTCVTKTLPIDQQVALLLKDVYGFKTRDIAVIVNRTEGVVKHLLHAARRDMMRIYDHRCALVSKTGICYQCVNLDDMFNGKGATLQEDIPILGQADDKDRTALYALRAQLVAQIDPLKAEGRALQDVFLEVFNDVNEPVEEEVSAGG